MRGRLILAGITDPLRQLTDMHALLDVAEVIMTEQADRKALTEHNRRVYGGVAAPRPAAARPRAAAIDPADMPDPPGFSAAEQRASWAAFHRHAN